jgi:two-component system nitrogen regulation sensor histidine kinase GlnL
MLAELKRNMKNRCYFRVNNDFVIRTWNSNMEKISHRSAKSVIGKNINIVFPVLYNRAKLVFRDGKKRCIKNAENICTIRKDQPFNVEINPIKNERGKVKELVVLFNNLPWEYSYGEKLSTSEERMIEIGKIASSLAHGVRNPLNAIKGAVAYLREKYGHEETLLEFSTIINDEINKLDSFISNFLSAAKAGVKSVPVNINDIIKRIFAMIKPRAEIQRIDVSTELSALPRIIADPFQIEQAIFNIINNAFEAMPKGGNLDVRTYLTWEKDIDYGVIEISDTGKGISRKRLNMLGELSHKAEHSNRGFGIFLSREIIKSHSGKLLWESVRGKGTTFKIFLPVKNNE